MPRESKVAPAARLDWLGAYERGERIDAIARRARRTERTIKAHIETARRERDLNRIRGDLQRNAYEQHYQDLLGIAQELRSKAQSPQHEVIHPGNGVRAKLLYESLKAHLPKGRLWQALSGWEYTAATLRAARRNLQREMDKQVQLRLVPIWEEVNAEWMAGSLVSAAELAARGSSPSLGEYRIKKEGEGWDLECSMFKLSQSIPTQELAEFLRQAHEKVVERLPGLEPVGQLREAQAAWDGARDALDTEVEILALSRVLPGVCPLCPGGADLMKQRRSRRRRKG